MTGISFYKQNLTKIKLTHKHKAHLYYVTAGSKYGYTVKAPNHESAFRMVSTWYHPDRSAAVTNMITGEVRVFRKKYDNNGNLTSIALLYKTAPYFTGKES